MFRPGDRVRHYAHGEGEVIKVTGMRASARFSRGDKWCECKDLAPASPVKAAATEQAAPEKAVADQTVAASAIAVAASSNDAPAETPAASEPVALEAEDEDPTERVARLVMQEVLAHALTEADAERGGRSRDLHEVAGASTEQADGAAPPPANDTATTPAVTGLDDGGGPVCAS